MRSGVPLLILLLSLWLLVSLGRWGFFSENSPAAFVVMEPREALTVWLGTGFKEEGLHQFSDGEAPLSVIKMAALEIPAESRFKPSWSQPLRDGERLDLVSSPAGEVNLLRTMLPAQQRILLHIPLHPDHMSRSDWEALPGIGPKLAQAIMIDRQNNGDFGDLEGLVRVKGIGEGRLREWRKYFVAGGQQFKK